MNNFAEEAAFHLGIASELEMSAQAYVHDADKEKRTEAISLANLHVQMSIANGLLAVVKELDYIDGRLAR